VLNKPSKLIYFRDVKYSKQIPKMSPKAVETIELKTAPFDPRFSNTNQTRYCYQSYLDFHRCEKVKGKGAEVCQYFLRTYRSMCPNAWVEKWDTQREEGTFPGRI